MTEIAESVEDAVRAEFAQLDAPATDAAIALLLARDVDRDGSSVTARATAARALVETMERIRSKASKHDDNDRPARGGVVASLTARRDRRQRRATESPDSLDSAGS